MYFIPIDSIKIENRIRRDFDEGAITALADSILSKGLLHPPVLRYNASLEFVLVAGERRIRAMKTLHAARKTFTYSAFDAANPGKPQTLQVPSGMIPASMLGDLSDIAIREAELEENTIRADLSWQERASYFNALHEHRTLQAVTDGTPPHTIADTAEEVIGRRTGYVQSVSDLLVLAKNMADPDISGAATPKEAMRTLRRKATKFLMEQLSANASTENAPVQLQNIDARGALLNIPDGQYDCIITDPPYAIDADSFGSQSSVGHDYADDAVAGLELLQIIATESFRVAKPQAHLYLFSAYERVAEISDMLADAGWTVWPRPLIWKKSNGMLPRPDHGPRYTYECIIFANKGKRPVLLSGAPDVLDFPAVAGTLLLHAAEKPVELMKNLISRSCAPGDSLLDPCAGTGTVLAAAKLLRLQALGFELNKDTYNIALNRLSET